jgi:hypothetical protein
MTDKPCLREVYAYLETAGASTSWEHGQIEAALAAEAAAQARVCRVPDGDEEWPADLAEALLRRVSRNLALRKLPLGLAVSEIEATRVAGTDIEVRRLESSHRRWVVA